MRVAISFCFLVSFSGSSANQSLAARIDRSRDLADVLAVDLHRQRLRLEAIAAAGVAGVGVLVARSSSRTQSLSVSRKRRSMLPITPSNGLALV